jgi:hypothetical protein
MTIKTFENNKKDTDKISLESAKNILFQLCSNLNIPLLKHEIEN